MEALSEIKKVIPNVKQQHQVWRYYLQSWSYDSGQIYCYDKELKHSFFVSTEKVAKQKYAYEQPDFTPDELAFFDLFVSQIKNESIRNASKEDMVFFLFPSMIQNLANHFHMTESGNYLDYLRKNYLEQWHGNWEKGCKPLLDKLKNAMTVTDLPCVEERYLFNYFLADQMFRTSKTTDLIRSLKQNDDIKSVSAPDGTKTYKVRSSSFCFFLSFQLVTTIAQMLTYENYHYHLLKSNDKSLSFLTSDQPVYFNTPDNSEDSLSLFYPVSPNICLEMNKDEPDSMSEVCDSVIQAINLKTINLSNRFVFSSNGLNQSFYSKEN